MNYSLIRWLSGSESDIFSEIELVPITEEEEDLHQKISGESVASLARNPQTHYLLLAIPISSSYSPYTGESRFKELIQIVGLVGLKEHVMVKVDTEKPLLYIYFGLSHLFSSNAIAMVCEEILMQNNFLLGESTIKVFPSNLNELSAKYLEHIIPFQVGIKSTLINRRFRSINCSTLERSRELFFELVKNMANPSFDILAAIRYLKENGGKQSSSRQLINNRRIVKRSDIWIDTHLQTIRGKWGIRLIPDIINDFAEYAIAIERIQKGDLLKFLSDRVCSSTGYQEAVQNGRTTSEIVQQHILDYFQKYSQNPIKWIYRVNTKLDPEPFTPLRQNISKKEVISVIESVMARSIVPKKVNELITLINQEIRDRLNAEGYTKYELMKLKEHWHPVHYKKPVN